MTRTSLISLTFRMEISTDTDSTRREKDTRSEKLRMLMLI